MVGRDALFARLRAEHPVARSSAHGGFCLLTRHADVRTALLDHESFSSAHPGRVAVPPTATDRPPLPPIEFDPPRQVEQVALVAPWFSAPRVATLAPAVRAGGGRLLAPLAGPVEVVGELALPLVSRALAIFLELPAQDADRWVEWARRIFATRVSEPERARQAQEELRTYVAGLLQERRAAPRGDVLSAVANGHVQGAPLPEQEATGYGVLLLLAGRDALVDAIGNALVHLARHPADQDRLRADPAALPRAVEELLRLESPITQLGRVTTREVTVAGIRIPADTTVAVVYGSANRDERVFPDADRAVLDRRRNAHLAFGAGTHRCPGAPLARLVLTTVLERALACGRWRPDPAVARTAKTNGDTRGWSRAGLVLERPPRSGGSGI